MTGPTKPVQTSASGRKERPVFRPLNLNFNVPWYPDGTPSIVYVFAVLGGLSLVGTFVYCVHVWNEYAQQGVPGGLFVLAALWGLIPAFWFWFEYHFLIVVQKRTDGSLKDAVEYYKYGVQLGLAIWAVATIGLAALATSDHFKKPEHEPAENKSIGGKPLNKAVTDNPPGKV